MTRSVRFVLVLLLGVTTLFTLSQNARAQTEVLVERALGDFEPAAGVSRVRAESTWWSRVSRDLSAGYFNFTRVSMEQANQQAGSLEGYNYLSLDYRLDRTRRVSLRPVFHFRTAGHDFKGDYKSGDFWWGDAILVFADRALTLLPSDIELSGQMRVYLPTSQESSSNGLITRLRPLLVATRRLTRDFTFSLSFEPDYYLQSRTGYLTDWGEVRGNRYLGYNSKSELSYRISRSFRAATSAGIEEGWSHDVPIEGVDGYHGQSMMLDLSMSAFIGNVFLVTGIGQKRDLLRPRTEFALFRETESTYYMLSSFRF